MVNLARPSRNLDQEAIRSCNEWQQPKSAGTDETNTVQWLAADTPGHKRARDVQREGAHSQHCTGPHVHGRCATVVQACRLNGPTAKRLCAIGRHVRVFFNYDLHGVFLHTTSSEVVASATLHRPHYWFAWLCVGRISYGRLRRYSYEFGPFARIFVSRLTVGHIDAAVR